MITTLNTLAGKLIVWYDKDIFQEFQFTISMFRMDLADKRFEFRKKEARRKQQELYYIQRYKNTTDMKSDKKCIAKYELDNQVTMMAFRTLRAEIEMLEEKLKAYTEQREAIKTNRIDYLSENKQMK